MTTPAPHPTGGTMSATEADRSDAEDALDAVFDALDVHHDRAWHVHAAECCWPFPGARTALREALAERDARVARETLLAAADEGAGVVYVGGLPLDAVSVDWLRDRAEATR